MRRAILLLAGGNLIGKLTGAGRELLLAAMYGTGTVIAAFRLAQNATLIPLHLILNDALMNAIVPGYKRALEEGPESGGRYAAAVFSVCAVLGTAVALVLTLLAGAWINLQAPRFDPVAASQASAFLVVLAWSAPFYICAGVLNYVSMANGEFSTTAVRPLFQNIGLMIGASVSVWSGWILSLAAGFTVAYLLYFLWVLYCARSSGFLMGRHFFGMTRSAVQNLIALGSAIRPLLPLPIFVQASYFVERAVASNIGTTEVAAIDYARFLLETAALLIAMPIGFAGLAHWSNKDGSYIRLQLARIVPCLLWVSVPIALLFVFLSKDIVQLIFGRGAFGSSSVGATSQILAVAALGLPAQIAGSVMLRALSAQSRNPEVFRIVLVSAACSIACNLLLGSALGAAALGLAMAAFSVCTCVLSATALNLIGPVARRSSGVLAATVLQGALLALISFGSSSPFRLPAAVALTALVWSLFSLRDRIPLWAIRGLIHRTTRDA